MKRQMHFGLGITSMLTVFVIMCLLAFAVLSYTSARADANLSEKVSDNATSYYKADSSANEHLSELDAALNTIYKASPKDKAAYEQSVRQWFAENTDDTLTGAKEGGLFAVSFDEEAGTNQTLTVTIEIMWPDEENPWYYKTTEWTTENTAEWSPDNTLSLAGG